MAGADILGSNECNFGLFQTQPYDNDDNRTFNFGSNVFTASGGGNTVETFSNPVRFGGTSLTQVSWLDLESMVTYHVHWHKCTQVISVIACSWAYKQLFNLLILMGNEVLMMMRLLTLYLLKSLSTLPHKASLNSPLLLESMEILRSPLAMH